MKKILIVDDSAFMRSWLKKLLSENEKITFVEAENGYCAIDTYKLQTPDLVLMDITMPKLNGIEALKEIIKFDPKAKIVICSSLGQRDFIIEAVNIGAKDFIVKPYFNNLLTILNNYM